MLLALAFLVPLELGAADPRAVAVVDRAAARMGGYEALRAIERVRYDMVTQWARITFDERPYTDFPSYEEHVDVRDYTIPAWRNTRRSGTFEFVDIVRDTVGARFARNAWRTLNTAYVDERRELFLYTPDRLILAAKASKDLKLLPDTAIGGMAHTRLQGSIAGFGGVTVFFRKADDLPAMIRFRGAHENDFGLVQWGNMDVEVWYSRWTTLQGGVSVPMQWDIRRVGKTYKRLSVNSMLVNPTFGADSFAVSDSIRDLFNRTQKRAMHDLPIDSAKITESRFATFGAFGMPNGAVKLGNSWLLLEAGQAPLSAERSVTWLQRTTNEKVGAAVLTNVSPGNGGIAWLTQQKIPAHVAPGAAIAAGLMLRNRNLPVSGFRALQTGQWLTLTGDSAWIEPIDLPNSRGTMVVYVPSLKWMYSASITTRLDQELLLEKMKTRGWTVERIGSARGLLTPVPE